MKIDSLTNYAFIEPNLLLNFVSPLSLFFNLNLRYLGI